MLAIAGFLAIGLGFLIAALVFLALCISGVELLMQDRAPQDGLHRIAAGEQSRFLSGQGTGYSDDIAALLPDWDRKYEDGYPVIGHTLFTNVTLEALRISPDGEAYCAVVRSPHGSYLAVSEKRPHPRGSEADSVSEAQKAALCLPSTK